MDSRPDFDSTCPYAVLGVDKNATLKQIKSAYRKLALVHHPDRAPNKSESEKKSAHVRFAAIANSYEILSDEGRRREYDESIVQRDNTNNMHQSQQHRQYQQQQRSHHDDFFGRGMFGGSLFNDPFFASSFGRRSQRGSDSHAHFTDPFELFERFFEEEMGHSRNNNRRGGARSSSSQRMDPFSDPFFSSMGGGFFDGASQMNANHFGMSSMFGTQQQQQQQQRFGSGMSYNFSSSSSSSGFDGGKSVSTSTRTTIINGVKQTVTEKTIVHPDGRVERFVDSSGGDTGRIASANSHHPALESGGRRRRRM